MMPVDDDGCIIHEGLQNPGFILDCMAWDFIDDYTGVWKVNALPPLHYFNCLRYWAWAHYKDPPNPGHIREIQLPKKDVVERTPSAHTTAMAAAYGLWAEDCLSQQKQRMFGASQFPLPGGTPKSQIWGVQFPKSASMPLFASHEQCSSPTDGGVPLHLGSMHQSTSVGSNLGNFKMSVGLNRADSVVTGLNSCTSPTPTRQGTTVSTTSSGSPVKRPSHNRQLSALATPFNPVMATVNPSLSSRAALPTLPGQLPGTFDVLSTHDKRNFTCLIVTDVPFNVTTNEILTHLKLGEREGLVHYGSDNPGIHIIQDRSDSKTHEVYIEMLSHEAALRVTRDMPRRGIKIGSTGASRKIKVEHCSQEEMMRALFPRPTKSHAWQFRWMGYDPDFNSIPDGFIGYVSSEDLHNAREWAEHPRKAKHADDAPQRVYEYMISTLIHLPKEVHAYGRLKSWRDTQEFVDRLFVTVVAMIKVLNCFIDDPKFAERHLRREHGHHLNFRLLKRFNQTCFDFPMFTEAQREQILVGF